MVTFAFTVNEAVTEAVFTADEDVATLASTVAEAVAKVASTADEGVGPCCEYMLKYRPSLSHEWILW